MISRSDWEPLPTPTLSPFARGYLSLCRFFTAAVWCVPALRVPLVHSLINHFRQKKRGASAFSICVVRKYLVRYCERVMHLDLQGAHKEADRRGVGGKTPRTTPVLCRDPTATPTRSKVQFRCRQ